MAPCDSCRSDQQSVEEGGGHPWTSRRRNERCSARELFYWAAILFTFALGTAAGDLVAETLQLGYVVSALIFRAGIAAVTAGYYYFKLPAIPAFWLAYILTRPFGASIGDLLSQPTASGGLGLGTIATSVVLVAAIGGRIGRMTVLRRGRPDAQGALPCRPHGPKATRLNR